MKRDPPAHALITPKPHDRRRLLFLLRLRLRAVLFLERKRGVDVHGQWPSVLQGQDNVVSVPFFARPQTVRIQRVRVTLHIWTRAPRAALLGLLIASVTSSCEIPSMSPRRTIGGFERFL